MHKIILVLNDQPVCSTVAQVSAPVSWSIMSIPNKELSVSSSHSFSVV